MGNPETVIKNRILIALGRVAGMFWNHPTGKARALQPPHPVISFGCKGSPDIIGVAPVTVTTKMVGSVVGVAVGIEVKTDTGRQSEQQKKFQAAFVAAGGVYVVARSVDDTVTRLAALQGGEL